mgnify:FL=1
MTQLSNLLPDAGRGMTIAEFEALREQRRSTFACSGYIEPGRHYVDASNVVVNQGIWCTINGGVPNGFRMGRGSGDSTQHGESDTSYPIYNVDGLRITQALVGASNRNTIVLPPAPTAEVETSTTTTKDYDVGDHVVVGNDIYICVLDAPSGMLLTDVTYFKPVDMVSREDLVGMEVFLVEIGDEGEQVPAVYPLGNVQYDGNSTGSKNYTDGVMPQSYSAFGTWDTVTWGRGFTWALMSEEEKDSFLNNPNNNIYRDGDRVFQWQYRFRSISSVGDDWRYNSGFDDYANNIIRNRGVKVPIRLTAQGSNPIPLNYNSGRYFYQINANDRAPGVDGGVAITNPEQTSNRAIGPIYWMGIARVTRMNQGAYHPFYNAMGTLLHAQTNSGGSTWDSTATAKLATSVADCFLGFEHGGSRIRSKYGGNIQYGASGHPQQYTYDGIYDWQMQDLRISAHGVDVDANAFGIDVMGGRHRGWERIKGLAFVRTTLTSSDIVEGEFTAPPAGKITKEDGQTVKQGGCWVYNVNKNQYVPAVKINRDDRDDYYYYLPSYVSPTLFEGSAFTNSSRSVFSEKGTRVYEGWDVGDDLIIMMPIQTPYSLEQLPVTEVFANPANLVDMVDRYGVDYVPGLIWSPVIPDDTSKTQPLTRRVIKRSNHLSTSQDLGDSWVNNNTYTASFNANDNAGSVIMPASTVMLMEYTYGSSVMEPMSFAERRVLASADLGHVFVLRADEKSTLIPTLIGKIGPYNSTVIYSKHALERAIMTYNEDEGSAFETSWSNDVIRHSNVTMKTFGDCVKFLPFLSEDLVEGIAYGSLTFRELKYDDDPKSITEIDLSTSVTHGLGINDRFILKNCPNPVMNGIVFVTRGAPVPTWNPTDFDGYSVNYEDGSVYNNVGILHSTFQVDPTNDVGDDNAMQYYPHITFMTNLNDYRVARGLSRTHRPLGFLPKEKR